MVPDDPKGNFLLGSFRKMASHNELARWDFHNDGRSKVDADEKKMPFRRDSCRRVIWECFAQYVMLLWTIL